MKKQPQKTLLAIALSVVSGTAMSMVMFLQWKMVSLKLV